MHILIGGGSGHIGKLLTSYLKQRGHRVTWISRYPGQDRITWQQLRWDEAPKDVEAIINLAGNRWMERPSMMVSTNFQATDVIERFQTSRWFTAKTCAMYCKERAEQGNPLKVYVQASSTLYYHINQETEDLIMTEEDEGGFNDKINRMVRQWETESALPEDINTRHVIIRNGFVLDPEDGLLMKYLHKFGCFIGGPISRHGQNPLNWVHKDDLVSLYAFAAENSHVNGILNGVAPSLNNHYDLCAAMKEVTKKPNWFSLPRMAHEMWYNPDVAKVMHESSWVEPKRTLSSGFHYRFGDLDGAIRDLVQKPVSLSQVARYRMVQRYRRHLQSSSDSYFYLEFVEKRGWNPLFVPFIAFFSYFSWFFVVLTIVFGGVYMHQFVSLFTDPI